MTPKEIEELVTVRVITACLECGLSGIQLEVAEDGEIAIWKDGVSSVRFYLPSSHDDDTVVSIRFHWHKNWLDENAPGYPEDWANDESPMIDYRDTGRIGTRYQLYSPHHLVRIALGLTDDEGLDRD